MTVLKFRAGLNPAGKTIAYGAWALILSDLKGVPLAKLIVILDFLFWALDSPARRLSSLQSVHTVLYRHRP